MAMSLKGTAPPQRSWLLVLAWSAALAGMPVFAQDANPTAKDTQRVGHLPKGFTEKSATVNGVRINYKAGGSGPVVLLLHGYTQTSHMWHPLMPVLAASHTVIAPDLRTHSYARNRGAAVIGTPVMSRWSTASPADRPFGVARARRSVRSARRL